MAPKTTKTTGRHFGSPNMSDTTLLVSVEDLINIAMGPTDKNVVNFKLIQTVLHILARQMRLLQQRVEIRIPDEGSSSSADYGTSRSPDKGRDRHERHSAKGKEKAERATSKERDKADRAESRDRERGEKDKDRADREASRDAKGERGVSKERDKAEKEKEKGERGSTKDKDKEERGASKDREKTEKGESKDRDKADKAAAKDREKDEKAGAKAEGKADKSDARADKAQGKDKDKAEKGEGKGKDKADKADAKEKEKAEKAEAREKADKAGAKDKGDKADAKEKDKAGKGEGKEKDRTDKADSKERDKADKLSAKDKEKAEKKGKGKGKTASDTSIVISEVERRKEKVLVVEKGPTTRADKGREGIEVVTRSQFDIISALVKDLAAKAGPLPAPALPDNQRLRSDLARGQASLTDTMQAMQVTARVRAAEQAISRMGDMLTALAAAGALPEDMADQIGEVRFEPPDMDADTTTGLSSKMRPGVSRKSVAIDPITMPGFGSDVSVATMGTLGGSVGGASRSSVAGPGAAPSRMSMAGRRASMTSRASVASGADLVGVTHPEMDDAIRSLKEDLQKSVAMMTAKATAVAEHASAIAKGVSDKLDIALKLDTRISTLYNMTSDYAEQLSGFDTGLTTQMISFRDQMGQMRSELSAGLKQLEQVNNNAETAAVLELTERYDGLVTELDHTLHAHRTLTSFQKQLGDELHGLVECVEMLREQKADRDEVLDGLRDKADNTRLAGLLTAIEFAAARCELEKRLDVCHDKFRRQECVWMTALKDLTNVTENKAEITQLLAAREQAEVMLRELQDKQMKLAVILGEPKAAMLTRALARGASCGACLAPALMEPQDESYGAPPPLPAMRRPRPLGEEPCAPAWKPEEPPDHRQHTCHRWVGGSHTLLSDAVTRERAPPLHLDRAPTSKYVGPGDDGRLYKLEEELQPCIECNKFSEPDGAPAPAPEVGGGDLGAAPPLTE